MTQALVTALCWFAWLGWDVHRDVDPTGHLTGPWEPWQVIGCVVCLIVVCSVAGRWLEAPIITVTMTASFAASCTVSALALSDNDPLVVVAITLATTAMLIGSAALSSFAGIFHADPQVHTRDDP